MPLDYQATPADAVRAGHELRSPIAATDETRQEGRRLFETFCAVCHGVNGDGDGPLVPKIPNPPRTRQRRRFVRCRPVSSFT